jgi:TM2 domain-containing membrane protein YozV
MYKFFISTLMLIMFLTSALYADNKSETLDSNNCFFAPQKMSLFAQSDDFDDEMYAFEDANSGKRKSVTTAVLLSLALPGLGEMYVGRTGRAAGFFTAEAGIWASFAYFKYKQSWLEDDYINLAVEHAGVSPEGKNDFFYDMVGFYDNRDEYNKISRVYTRTNPFFPESPEWDWQWESNELQSQYRDIKNDSKSQGRNANFTLGLALANRVISAVDAWWSAKSYNRQFSPLMSNLHIKLTPSIVDIVTGNGSPGFMLSYKHKF